MSAKLSEALSPAKGEAEVTGTVTFVGEDFFFLQNGDDGMKVFGRRLPRRGDELAVLGTPSLEGGHVVFVAQSWQKRGERPLPASRPLAMDDLVYAGGAKKSANWLRVAIAGRVLGVTESGFALNVDNVPVNVMMTRVPDFLADCERTHPCVTIRGVVELVLDQSVLLGRSNSVMGVKVYVGSPDDVTLVPDAPYLAARNRQQVLTWGAVLMTLLAVGLMVLAAVIFRQRRRIFQTRTVMAERKRMADDLHDTIEQHLVGAGMLLKLGRLKEAQDVLVRAKREIRDIVWGLMNDDMMRLSPTEMIRQLAHDENQKGVCRVDTHLSGLPAKMDAARMRDLSLIVREAIGNAVKHGRATRVAISCDARSAGGWLLRISNNGAPFDPATAPGAKEGHFGLEGMRQRACRLGATVALGPRKEGMVVEVERA